MLNGTDRLWEHAIQAGFWAASWVGVTPFIYNLRSCWITSVIDTLQAVMSQADLPAGQRETHADLLSTVSYPSRPPVIPSSMFAQGLL